MKSIVVLFAGIAIAGCGGAATTAVCHSVAGESCSTTSGCDYGACSCESGVIVCRDPPPANDCNDLSLEGTPLVQFDYVALDAPASDGGTIVDGTYVLTSGSFYTGAGGRSGPAPDKGRAVYRFRAGRFDSFGDSGSQSGTFTTRGNNLIVTPTCHAPGQTYFLNFSATSTTIMLDNDSTWERSFLTRQ
jgi:hypothetical protein